MEHFMEIFNINWSNPQLVDGLKLFYAAEIGIATFSELTIGALGIDKIARPIVDFQRLNAAAQLALWGALIYHLEAEAKQTTVQS
jgi:hypothetical protein